MLPNQLQCNVLLFHFNFGVFFVCYVWASCMSCESFMCELYSVCPHSRGTHTHTFAHKLPLLQTLMTLSLSILLKMQGIRCLSHLYTYSCQIDKIYFPFAHGFDIALKMPVLCFPNVFRNSWLFYICKFACKFEYQQRLKERKQVEERWWRKMKWKLRRRRRWESKKKKKIWAHEIENGGRREEEVRRSQVHLF